jgi:hypothetical protein
MGEGSLDREVEVGNVCRYLGPCCCCCCCSLSTAVAHVQGVLARSSHELPQAKRIP